KLLEPVSIFSKKFDEVVAALTSPEAKASEIEHAIRHEIHVRLEENPVFYESLKARLEKIIEERKQERISAAEELRYLNTLVEEMRNIGKTAQDLGFSETEYALYKILAADSSSSGESERFKGYVIKEPSAHYGVLPADASILTREKELQKDLTHTILETLEKLAVIDWTQKNDVQREMRRQTKYILRTKGYESDEIERLTIKIMDLARVRLAK
ncbi:unnamed protein product, partial [marine sediment metagenome]